MLFYSADIFLEKLIRTKTLTGYTHIVLAGVHERKADMDFLLIIVQSLLKLNSWNTKIIVSTAANSEIVGSKLIFFIDL